MNLDDLKEQFQALGQKISDQLQEVPVFVQLKERFDGLTPASQKMVVFGGIVAAWLFVLSIPWGWKSESGYYVENFETRRTLIRDLLKASREAAQVPNVPPAPPDETLRVDVESRLQSMNVGPEQIASIETSTGGSNLIPADRSSGLLDVNLKKLNVQQVVQAGTQLSRISPSVKMTAIEMIANKEDARYYDVKYRLIALAVPDLSVTDDEAPAGGRQ